MPKSKYIISIIFILIIISAVVLIYFKQFQNNENFSVSYHYTTEFTYFDANITNLKLVYTYINEDLIGKRLEPNTAPQQRAYWTSDDLKTKEIQLTKKEIIELRNLVKETKIMQLENYYGPEQGARCYPHILKIILDRTEKEINYCSGFNGPTEPKSFKKVREKIEELVSQKFPGQS